MHDSLAPSPPSGAVVARDRERRLTMATWFGKRATEITFKDLVEIVAAKTAESLTVEFKRGLTLTDKEKREAPKDVSGFANSNGGYLFYGIEETESPTQGKIAGSLEPLQVDVRDRLCDVLGTTISPRCEFEHHWIADESGKGGGYIVLRVYPSYSNLLWVGGRCYHRTPKPASDPMSPREIEDRFRLILRAKDDTQARLDELIQKSVASSATSLNFFAMPLFGQRDAVDISRVESSFFDVPDRSEWFVSKSAHGRASGIGFVVAPGGAGSLTLHRDGTIQQKR